MDPKSLIKQAACVDEALHFFVASNTSWETASNYFVGSKSPRSTHRNEISDPGVRLRSSQPLPQSLTSLCSNVQYKSFMGLFPEINRAWLTVDSNIFFWAYTPFGSPSSSYDFYAYEGFDQVIVSLALITPKQGVFVDSVRYLIAVATPLEVTLLGVTFSSTGQLSLVPTHMTIPTDNVLMLKILSAPDGRIFMAGADGDLHEFLYADQHRSAVFDFISPRPRKRARKVSHSSSGIAAYLLPAAVKSWISSQNELVDLAVHGNALFTLSQSGVLTVYDISDERIQFVATSNIASDAKHHFSFSIPPSEREFVSIHPVPALSSSSVQLVVITSLAERLYYTTQSPGNTPFNSANKPLALLCIGFRPAPLLDISQSSSRPCVHLAWSYGSATVFADLRDNQSDNLICIFPEANTTPLSSTRSDVPQHSSHSSEVVTLSSLDVAEGDSEHFSTTPNQQLQYSRNAILPRTPTRTFAIAGVDEQMVREYHRSPVIQPPTFFWVLSSDAVQLFERVSPLDELQDLLASSRDASTQIQAFFDRYGAADACAMCLEIAVSNPSLTFAAAHSFYAYGLTTGTGHGLKFSQAWSRRRSGADTDDAAQSVDGGGFDVGRAALRSSAFSRCSGAHDGLVVYLAGALQQIWNCFLTKSQATQNHLELFTSKEDLALIREELLKAVAFLERFPPEAPPTNVDPLNPQCTIPGPHARSDGGDIGGLDVAVSLREKPERYGENRADLRISNDARQREHSSINAMKNLAVRACEALALLLVVSDHQLHRLTIAMPLEYCQRLVNTRFSGLVAGPDGAIVASSLIESIFSSYPDGGAAMASVGRILQERCPSYFGSHDVDLHRGLALIRQAVKDISNSEGNFVPQGNLKSDLGTDQWMQSMARVEEGVSILKSVPDRIFDIDVVFKDLKSLESLPLLVDLGLCIGLQAEESGQSERAQNVYTSVVESLIPLFSLETDELTRLRDASVHVALTSKSDAFLNQLYEFLQKSRQGEEALMSHSSESIEIYLINKECWSVLWKYYARHEQYFKAGSVLLKLAESENCTLSERMEYLSSALLNAKSASSQGTERAAELLAEVGDFLDVARVQMRVREGVARMTFEGTATNSGDLGSQNDVRKALESLDNELMDLTTLFNKYARRFNLLEGCLECLRCGSYRDDAYARQVWAEIVERELDMCNGNSSVLKDRLEGIGREFYPSEVAFPTVLILDVFQKYVYEHSVFVSTDWATETLERIGVSLSEILEGFRGLIENGIGNSCALTGKDRYEVRWSDDKAQFHLIEATALSIMKWLDKEEENSAVAGRLNGLECESVMRVLQAAKSRLRGLGRGNCMELWQKLEHLEKRVGEI